ncbi:MAG: inosine-uridine preferring nucleoside hydrolase family protein [Alphaproteobacteria bacterium]|nr:inosine-uridine preferring nucleoside hydrolase family protein [Alphaproteobacteria bacterium]
MFKPAIIIDHDAGTNPDDVLAFLLLLNSARADIRMTVSGNKFPVERARYAHKFFAAMGRADIPCYAGEKNGHVDFHAQKDIEGYTYEPPDDYLSRLKELCETEDNIVYLAIQGLSNLDRFLSLYPQYSPKLSVFHMGMTLPKANNEWIKGGTNMEIDSSAASRVYQFPNLDLKIVGAHTTIHDALRLSPDTPLYRKLFIDGGTAYEMIRNALQDFYNRRGIWPALHDPLTASAAIGCDFVRFTSQRVDFDESGAYRLGKNSAVMISADADYRHFMDYFFGLL